MRTFWWNRTVRTATCLFVLSLSGKVTRYKRHEAEGQIWLHIQTLMRQGTYARSQTRCLLELWTMNGHQTRSKICTRETADRIHSSKAQKDRLATGQHLLRQQHHPLASAEPQIIDPPFFRPLRPEPSIPPVRYPHRPSSLFSSRLP